MPIWIALLIEVLEQGTFDNLLLSNISCCKTSTSEMIQRGTDLAAIFFVNNNEKMKIYHNANN